MYHQVWRKRKNTNLKGRRPELLICFALSLGGKTVSFNVLLWIVHEGRWDQSLPLRPDPPSEQGSAWCHPPGQRDSGRCCHPASSRLQPPRHRRLGHRCDSVPRQFCYVQWWGHGEHCGLCQVKPHVQQCGTLGRWGLQREGAHAMGMVGQLGTAVLYSHRGATPSIELKV